MSYANFKPVFWNGHIQTELERKCKLVGNCWSQFEGEAKKGSKVKILGIGSPSIGDYTGAAIGTPETIEDTSIYLEINQAKFFNFQIDDIDKAQAKKGLMEMFMDEAVKKMAVERDKFVASLAKDAGKTSASTKVDTVAAAKKAIDDGLLWLRENDVDVEDNVVIEVPHFLYQKFKDNLVELKTNNDELIKKGVVGMYDNCQVITTNNLYNDGTDDYAMIRTSKAIAFAGGIDETEPYRPEQLFSDAIKGLNTFGAKVVRPKELYAVRVHK